MCTPPISVSIAQLRNILTGVQGLFSDISKYIVFLAPNGSKMLRHYYGVTLFLPVVYTGENAAQKAAGKSTQYRCFQRARTALKSCKHQPYFRYEEFACGRSFT